MADVATFQRIGPFWVSGAIASGIKVYHYDAGTSTAKDVWLQRAKTSTADNPVIGGSNGVATFYGDGLYKIQVHESNDTQLYAWDNYQIGPSHQPVAFAADLGGTNQTSLTTSTYSLVSFTNTVFDTSGLSSSSRWIPGRTGKALVLGRVEATSTNLSQVRLFLNVYQNGTQGIGASQQVGGSAINADGPNVIGIFSVASTADYFELHLWHDRGSDLEIHGDAVQTYMMGVMLS